MAVKSFYATRPAIRAGIERTISIPALEEDRAERVTVGRFAARDGIDTKRATGEVVINAIPSPHGNIENRQVAIYLTDPEASQAEVTDKSSAKEGTVLAR